MTGLNNIMDKRIAERQKNCPHYYQDIIAIPQGGTFCGKCAKRMIEK